MAHLMPPSLPAAPGWVRLQERAGMGWRDWQQAFLDRFAELVYFRAEQAKVWQ